MATAVIMPKQGQSVETCIITKWFKNTGDTVKAGDILLSYETDKAAFDIESTVEGILLERYYEEGAEVPVLVNIAVIGISGENIDSFISDQKTGDTTFEASLTTMGSDVVAADDEANMPVKEVTVTASGRIRISPRAKRLATDNNVDYSSFHGSGPNGRIITADIEKFLESSSSGKPGELAADEYRDQPLSNIRKIIARAMYDSLQNSAQVTHHMSADVRRLLETRRRIKKIQLENSGQQDITLNDMVCWCVIRALEKYPAMNSHLLDNSIRTFNAVHIGVAVDTPRGLMVPAVKNANTMTLDELSGALKSVAESCKKGSIDPEFIQSSAATFTVSNLGNYGVEMFTPVINLPQTGILGVCTIINRPADLGNNTFGFIPHIGLSLTYDHRAVDGGPATLFLKEIKDQIEAFKY